MKLYFQGVLVGVILVLLLLTLTGATKAALKSEDIN